MTGFIAGAVLIYAVGVVQVYRERREYFARNVTPEPSAWAALRVAIRWPLAVGPKW